MNSTILALKQFVIVALQPLEADTGTTLSMCREREREKKSPVYTRTFITVDMSQRQLLKVAQCYFLAQLPVSCVETALLQI